MACENCPQKNNIVDADGERIGHIPSDLRSLCPVADSVFCPAVSVYGTPFGIDQSVQLTKSEPSVAELPQETNGITWI